MRGSFEMFEQTSMRRPCSSAKERELIGNNIFGPPADLPSECLAMYLMENSRIEQLQKLLLELDAPLLKSPMIEDPDAEGVFEFVENQR
eukprot:c737_g1_i1 orf=64-330(+)